MSFHFFYFLLSGEISEVLPHEGIRSKVGSFFSSIFSANRSVPIPAPEFVTPILSSWPGESCVPSAAQYIDIPIKHNSDDELASSTSQ